MSHQCAPRPHTDGTRIPGFCRSRRHTAPGASRIPGPAPGIIWGYFLKYICSGYTAPKYTMIQGPVKPPNPSCS